MAVQLQNIPLSDGICEKGGTYIGNIRIRFHMDGSNERTQLHVLLSKWFQWNSV